MPMQLFTVGGVRLGEQPTMNDTGATLRSRVAAELGVDCESVQLLHGRSCVSDQSLLVDLGSGHLQVMVTVPLKKKLNEFGQKASPTGADVQKFFTAVEIETKAELDVGCVE